METSFFTLALLFIAFAFWDFAVRGVQNAKTAPVSLGLALLFVIIGRLGA